MDEEEVDVMETEGKGGSVCNKDGRKERGVDVMKVERRG